MSTATQPSRRFAATFAPGDERAVSRAELERELGPVPPAADAEHYTRASLVHHGLEAAGPAGEDGALRLRLTPRYALQGALALTVALAVLAALGRPLYGVVVLVLGGVGCAVLAGRWSAVAGRAPAWLPRGRVLGAAAVIPFLVVAALIDAELRHRHVVSLRHDAAAKAVQNANAALDRGDAAAAISNLAYAESNDPHAKGLETARARLVITQSSGKIKALKRRIAELEAQIRRGR